MTNDEIINAISDNFLCVRRLPFEVVSLWTYNEGDENKKYVDSNGNLSTSKKEVIIQDFDLEYFKKKKPPKWNTDSPEKRFENWKKSFPNGRKLLKETKTVEKGGWWYVKEARNMDSMIRFNRKYDEFFAPTLNEAVELYLNSKK